MSKTLSNYDLKFMAINEKQAHVIGFLEGLQIAFAASNPEFRDVFRTITHEARDVNIVALEICHKLQDESTL